MRSQLLDRCCARLPAGTSKACRSHARIGFEPRRGVGHAYGLVMLHYLVEAGQCVVDLPATHASAPTIFFMKYIIFTAVSRLQQNGVAFRPHISQLRQASMVLGFLLSAAETMLRKKTQSQQGQ